MGIRRWAHYGNVQDSVTLAKHQTLIPDKTDDMGLWTFMKREQEILALADHHRSPSCWWPGRVGSAIS